MGAIQPKSAKGKGWRLYGASLLQGDRKRMGTDILRADAGGVYAQRYAEREPCVGRVSQAMRIQTAYHPE